MDFLLEGQPKDVLARTEALLARHGFGSHMSSTETTRVFQRVREGLSTVTAGFAGIYNVQFVAVAEGEGETRLTFTANHRKTLLEVGQWVVNELGATPLDADFIPEVSQDPVPVYEKRGGNTLCRLFTDHVEIHSGSDAPEVMGISEIREVRTGWGRLRAFAKVIIEGHDGRELELGKLHILEAQKLKQKIEEQMAQRVDEPIVKPSHPAAEPVQPAEPPKNLDIPDQIRKLAELRDAGVLTEEEFERKKAELLDRM